MAPDGNADADAARARARLRRLAGADGAVIDRADAAVDDVDAAVEFVETTGLEALAAAVEAADDPRERERGQRALAAFRRFHAAADGGSTDHFHPGHDTDLRRDAEGSNR